LIAVHPVEDVVASAEVEVTKTGTLLPEVAEAGVGISAETPGTRTVVDMGITFPNLHIHPQPQAAAGKKLRLLLLVEMMALRRRAR
jgi:hypothetical protein